MCARARVCVCVCVCTACVVWCGIQNQNRKPCLKKFRSTSTGMCGSVDHPPPPPKGGQNGSYREFPPFLSFGVSGIFPFGLQCIWNLVTPILPTAPCPIGTGGSLGLASSLFLRVKRWQDGADQRPNDVIRWCRLLLADGHATGALSQVEHSPTPYPTISLGCSWNKF